VDDNPLIERLKPLRHQFAAFPAPSHFRVAVARRLLIAQKLS
jgi:hypothetical protein